MDAGKKDEDSFGQFSYEVWLRKRKLTFIIFIYQSLLIGFDDGVVSRNLWIYIKRMVKTDHQEVFYSIILASYSLSGILATGVITRIADRTRNIRIIFFFCNSMVVIGSALYTLHFSPWFLVVGRVLCGFACPMKSVIIGEIARCTEKEKLTSKISLIAMMGILGVMAAPFVNMMFVNVHSQIGSWHIAYGNIPGIVLALLHSLLLISGAFLLHNISKEYDLKAETEETLKVNEGNLSAISLEGSDNVEKNSRLDDNMKSVKWVIVQLFTHCDTSLLITTCFIVKFLLKSFQIVTPILIISMLKWPINVLNAYLAIMGISCVIMCILFRRGGFSNQVVYIAGVCSLIGLLLLQLNYTISFLCPDIFAINVFLTVIRPLNSALVAIAEEIFIATFLSKLVSSQYQSFADSIRMSVSKSGELIAFATTLLAYSRVIIMGPIYMGAVLIFSIILIHRRKTLADPQIIIR